MRRIQHIRVPVFPEEKSDIERRAACAGGSVAAYLRTVGMSYQPPSVIDAGRVRELLAINGDLGRLGGLLKMWLVDDRRVRHFTTRDLDELLDRIDRTRAKLDDAIDALPLLRLTAVDSQVLAAKSSSETSEP